jgi:hypothetical protein
MGCSPAVLVEHFKQSLGLSPAEYLSRLAFEKVFDIYGKQDALWKKQRYTPVNRCTWIGSDRWVGDRTLMSDVFEVWIGPSERNNRRRPKDRPVAISRAVSSNPPRTRSKRTLQWGDELHRFVPLKAGDNRRGTVSSLSHVLAPADLVASAANRGTGGRLPPNGGGLSHGRCRARVCHTEMRCEYWLSPSAHLAMAAQQPAATGSIAGCMSNIVNQRIPGTTALARPTTGRGKFRRDADGSQMERLDAGCCRLCWLRGLATNIICSFGGPQREPSVTRAKADAVAWERNGLLNGRPPHKHLRFP